MITTHINRVSILSASILSTNVILIALLSLGNHYYPRCISTELPNNNNHNDLCPVAVDDSMIVKSARTLINLTSKKMYSIVERGTINTPDYRVFFKNAEGHIVSPFHDIPLVADAKAKTYNMIVEIPKFTNAKMEIATKEPFNPIKQDVKKGALRFVHNCFPYHGYLWNYGALPQTWENPKHIDERTKAMGDNDPIDVCEIGSLQLKRGQVVPVKVLGVMALIDDGETDWKLLVINANDPMAAKLNDLDDIETLMPGYIDATREWFKIYKLPDGKPLNKFAFDGKAQNREFAEKILQETHQQWKDLIGNAANKGHELSLKNLCVSQSPFKVASASDGQQAVDGSKAFKTDQHLTLEERTQIEKWSFVPRSH